MSNNQYVMILAVLIACSAFFSATETAFSSLNKIRLKFYANNGNKRAEKTLDITENFGKMLSTVLIGNNIVNVFSSSLAAAYCLNLFGDNGLFISTIAMTILVLIFGEIMPKTIAKKYPEKLAMAVTPVISIIITILRPISFIFEFMEKGLNKLFKDEDDDGNLPEEIITMVEEAQEDGDMDDREADLITNAIEFNDLDVREILTPRVDVIAIDVEMNLEEIDKVYRESGFSRIPCYEGNIDNIIGILHEKDFYQVYYKKKDTPIRKILGDVVYTSAHVKISALLHQLQSTKSHMAVVIDEYGGTAGIITMEDILEELVGEIYDEHDEIVEYYKKIDDHTYLVKGDLEVDELMEYFGIDDLDEEYEFNTTSAWVIHNLDKIPLKGDSFRFRNWVVTVTKADLKKVIEIMIVINDDEGNKD